MSPADDGVGHQVQTPRKRKSCKVYLYYSSLLNSKSQSPRCIGISRTLQQVPNYIVEETEAEWHKTGQQLADFRYSCIGYSVYMEKNGVSGDQRNKQPDLPFCVGMEVLLDKKALESAATNIDVYAHKTEDGQSSSQRRTHKPAPARHADLTQVQRLDGLDVVGVQTVINDACPRDLSCYVHRVGRTARAGGRGGCAVGKEGTAKSRNGDHKGRKYDCTS